MNENQRAVIGGNGAPFDFFEFFDLVVNSSATTAEKLLALVHGRHIRRQDGQAAMVKRARAMAQASVSENTFQRSLNAMRLFFDVEQRRGRATLYHPKRVITADEIEHAIAELRPKSTPHKSAPQNGVHPESTPQNGVRVHPKMGRHNVGINITTLDWRTREAQDVLTDRLLDACNGAAANPAIAPGILVLSEPIKWLESGHDLDLDILPTIRARAHKMRPGSIKNWSYFTQAVADAKANRSAPMPDGQAAPPGRPKSWQDEQDEMRRKLLALCDQGE